MKSSFIAACAAAIVIASPASAGRINSATTGLTSPATTITFGEVPLASGTTVTNQYAALGVTFQNATATPQDYPATNFSGANIGNFGGTSSITTPTTLLFGTVQNSVAFNMISNLSAFTFTAFLGNTIVDSFGGTVGTGANNFYGFTNLQFDRIQITPTDAFLLDNLQLGSANAAVPEPATWAMMLLGFGALGFAMRRRSGVATRVRYA